MPGLADQLALAGRLDLEDAQGLRAELIIV